MVLGSILQLTVNELGGTVVYDSREDSVDSLVVDRYKEGYKEAMRDIWRWAEDPKIIDYKHSGSVVVLLKEFIQSQIKSAE